MLRKIYIFILFLIISFKIPIYSENKIEIFAIHSNIIKSWVQYAIKLNVNREFYNNEPVLVYRKRPSGSYRNLSFFERRYYGFDSQKILNTDTIEVKLKALPSKKVTIKIMNNKIMTYININGKQCILKSVMIHAKKGFFTIYTGYVDIVGLDIQKGDLLLERIYKD